MSPVFFKNRAIQCIDPPPLHCGYPSCWAKSNAMLKFNSTISNSPAFVFFFFGNDRISLVGHKKKRNLPHPQGARFYAPRPRRHQWCHHHEGKTCNLRSALCQTKKIRRRGQTEKCHRTCFSCDIVLLKLVSTWYVSTVFVQYWPRNAGCIFLACWQGFTRDLQE